MSLFTTRWIQIIVVLLYPVATFGILSEWETLNPWVLIVVTLLFCSLWRDVRYLLISTVLMFLATVPLWWIFIERTMKGAHLILGWYPLIIIEFICFVLLPEILIVYARNAVLSHFAKQRG